MNFGQAIEAAQGGQRITRANWNGKGMWVCFMPPTTIPSGLVNGRTRTFVPEGDLVVGGYFVMWTAAGVWQPGWLASQADMIADDWDVVP
jgi:hypothetical protein